MTVDHRQHHLEEIRAWIALGLYPIQYVAALPGRVGAWASESLASRGALIKENRQLREEQLLLEARLQRFNTILAENQRLRQLFHSSARVSERVLIGELISVDLDPFRHLVTINKGTQDGVYVSQPVLDAEGVMGQVIRTTYNTNTTMLITDPAHAVPAEVNRSGLRVIVLGTGESHRLEIPHIPANADIEKGDLLITSGLGGQFPPGYPVANVTSVARDPAEPFLVITAEPAARLERTREALLIWAGDHRPPTEAGDPEVAP